MGEIRIEERGRVLLATIDNPPHGLMDSRIVADLAVLVQRADRDDGVGAVVLTGAHPERFVAHYDVGELLAGAQAAPSVGRRAAKASLRTAGTLRHVPGMERALERTPAAGLVALERFHETFLAMNRSGAVFVAALNGSAMGGGCELALACDARMMAAGEFGIGQPEILFGFPPGGGGTQRLARLLGSAKALRLVIDGAPLAPAQALELGLIDAVVPADVLVESAIAIAGRLGARPKAGVAACKRAVYEGGSLPLADGLLVERSEFMATIGTEDAKEAMAAYQSGLERTGDLPGYQPELLDRALQSGRFGA
jgi:enoyl-CoA hydratase/carnithine racemase